MRERLRRTADFERVYEQGSVFQGRHVVLFCLTAGVDQRKAGFVASRKIGGAVERNRARRRIREAYRKLRSGLPGNAHLVFVARAGVTDIGWDELLADVAGLLKKAGLLTA
ncbi:MAG: ribonuclease P protein component [Candidatus Eisenbacteria bacterium]|nr:ribonuclease P protein component [Candidatus Eisenbacteria bacterium]